MEPQTQPLVCPTHTTQYIGVLIAGLLVGAGASFVYFKQAPASIGGGTYQDGFDTAKNLVLNSPMGMMFRAPDDIRAISGTVTEVKGDRIVIHTQSQNPFDDPALLDRTIVITKDTKITKITQEDAKALQAKMDAFMKTMETNRQAGKSDGAILPVPPEPTRTTVPASSIAIGETLIATAVENIKTMKEFSASEIQI